MNHKRYSKRFVGFLFVLPMIILLVSVLIFPLLYALYNSFFSRQLTFIGFGNYRVIFSDSRFFNSLSASLKFSISAVAIEFFLGFILALVFDRFLSARNFFVSILLLPMMVTPIVVGIVWRMLYHPNAGIINWFLSLLKIKGPLWLASPRWALPALIIADVWQWTPLMFLILLAGLQSLPSEPFEAARVDGANAWQLLRFITIPLMVPVIMVALIMRLLEALRIFDQVFMLTHGGPGSVTETLSFFIYKAGFKWSDMGYASALSFVFMAIIFILSYLLIRLIGREA